jgi:type II secretory pathway component PulF
MIGFYPFKCALDDIKKKLAKGATLSEVMEHYTIFDIN